MKSKYTFLLALILASVAALGQTNKVSTDLIYACTYDGVVDAPRTDYLMRCIDKAESEQAQALIVRLNTPGGSLQETKRIVDRLLNNKVPIIVYVTPKGGWAGSAGVFITMSADVAVMSPGTSIGAASPVSSEGDIPKGDTRDKIRNFTTAWARSIAELRGRNAKWAEEAVTKAASITETQALEKHVIDLIASDQADLVKKLNNRTLTMHDKTKAVLKTNNSAVQDIETTFGERLLMILVNPYMLIILGTIALYGIIAEIQNPGAIFPGVTGAIALLLLLYGGSFLPINIVGIGFIILAVALFLIDVYAPTHGVLSVGGVIALFFGLLMMFPSDFGTPLVSPVFALIVSLSIGAFFVFIVAAIVKGQLRKKITGKEGLIDLTAEVRTDLKPHGTVFVDGALWRAECRHGTADKGDKVIVKSVEGLTLIVEPLTTDTNEEA